MAAMRKSVQRSVGLLGCRSIEGVWHFLLAHPGGPYFARRDTGVWTIPKGLMEAGEEPLCAARREFREELGIVPPADGYIDLGEIRYASGKRVRAWACLLRDEPVFVESNRFELEWPPRSGVLQSFPEVDRAELFSREQALIKILPAQRPLIERAVAQLVKLRAGA